ncbi:cysteine desulfurase [Rhodobacteraceae bacterium NNCM2]|nr:cysteine desulfurase [Coraliihabitans acroporae]
MTGLNGQRVYLDWNATAPLRPEARAAMCEAMDLVGNPSSVHAEGRAAKMLVEKARAQVARLCGCTAGQVVFTSGATEAAMWSLKDMNCARSEVEHDCVVAWTTATLPTGPDGQIGVSEAPSARQVANSETGVLQTQRPEAVFADAVQAFGKVETRFADLIADSAAVSAHKLGGPKGVGAWIVRDADRHAARLFGGGQEQGRRSGTENIVGIAGFGAAAEAAMRDLDAGVWNRVENLRNILEERLESAARDLIICGKDAPRLPNTSCFAVPGWKGETQVMQMDLSGFAVSAGSACSSGKVNKASRVLMAMGFDETTASSAIRVSMGPTTTEAEVTAFADRWTDNYNRRATRAA